MSTLLYSPPRLESPLKVNNGSLILPFSEIVPRGRSARRGERNAYLARLSAFKKNLLDDPPYTLVSLFAAAVALTSA